MQRLTKGTVILPTTEFFPEEYHRTADEIQIIMKLVAEYMNVDPSLLQLNFYEDFRPEIDGMWIESSAGMYSESDRIFDIWLEIHSLDNPLNLIATLAHEIGHVLLLGQRRISHNEEDHEPLTDLLTVFLGLGLFPANVAVQERYWNDGPLSGWSMGRQGYLSMDMFGYAFALFAIARGEIAPKWLTQLRLDVRSACKQGMRYITETGDCSCEFITPR
ncbi:hypothetical protein [Gimesia sp.]|uniref:hypothetical protein n=1 Tax=Gimesia sp. TaxID=2024833 RepID=UPI003A941CFD